MEYVTMSLFDKLYSRLKSVCTNCGSKTDGIICLNDKCRHAVLTVEPEDQSAHLLLTFNRLRKFMMLSTGVPSVDEQVRAMYGPWLTPSEEFAAIVREANRPNLSPERKDDLQARLKVRVLLGVEDKDTRFEPFWEVATRHIPIEVKDTSGRKTGEKRFIKHRTLFVYTNPVQDSGRYRIAKRLGRYGVTDDMTGKRVQDLDSEGLDRFLGFYFDQTTIYQIRGELA
jgi:hypothetical protein